MKDPYILKKESILSAWENGWKNDFYTAIEKNKTSFSKALHESAKEYAKKHNDHFSEVVYEKFLDNSVYLSFRNRIMRIFGITQNDNQIISIDILSALGETQEKIHAILGIQTTAPEEKIQMSQEILIDYWNQSGRDLFLSISKKEKTVFKRTLLKMMKESNNDVLMNFVDGLYPGEQGHVMRFGKKIAHLLGLTEYNEKEIILRLCKGNAAHIKEVGASLKMNKPKELQPYVEPTRKIRRTKN